MHSLSDTRPFPRNCYCWGNGGGYGPVGGMGIVVLRLCQRGGFQDLGMVATTWGQSWKVGLWVTRRAAQDQHHDL
jgi:hypothetical protein